MAGFIHVLVHVPEREREGGREGERERERERGSFSVDLRVCVFFFNTEKKKKKKKRKKGGGGARERGREREREWLDPCVRARSREREGGEEREGKSHRILCHPGVHPHQGRRIQVALAPLCSCTFQASLTDFLPSSSSYHY